MWASCCLGAVLTLFLLCVAAQLSRSEWQAHNLMPSEVQLTAETALQGEGITVSQRPAQAPQTARAPHCGPQLAVPGSRLCRDSHFTCWQPRSCHVKQSAVHVQLHHTSPRCASTLRCAGTAATPKGRSDDALTLLNGRQSQRILQSMYVRCQALLCSFMLVRLSPAHCAAGLALLGHLAVAAVIQV